MSKTSPSDIDVHVGYKLKILRIKSGKSLQELASVLNVSFQQVQKYEKGQNKISSSNLFIIAQHFNSDINYFFDGMSESIKDSKNFNLYEESDSFNHMHNVSDQEIVSLIKSFYKISDAGVRRKILDLVKIL